MDKDDFWWLFEKYDYTDLVEVKSGRSDKDWIGWFFLALCVALILVAVAAVVYAIATYK